VLFIGDEVITGFCRTGQWFALTHWNVQPDIMSFAKAVTSGYAPLGGIMVSHEIHEAINTVAPENRWMHAYTYSGHPMCCAVGLANIEIMERERLWERSAKLGTRLHAGLLSLQKELPAIGDVRGGKGLIAAAELVADRATKVGFPNDQKVGFRVRREMEKRGLVTRIRTYPTGPTTSSEQVFFSPPLVITEEQLDRVLEIVRASTGGGRPCPAPGPARGDRTGRRSAAGAPPAGRRDGTGAPFSARRGPSELAPPGCPARAAVRW
jgi:adenosylmethionine-8-amino-7-oxononanoate aminotransferase